MDSTSLSPVEVTWIDANFHPGWTTAEELNELLSEPLEDFHVKTVGYILAISDERIILSMSITVDDSSDEKVGEVYWIPRGCVLEIRELCRVDEVK